MVILNKMHATNLNMGAGFDWAKHVKAMDESFLSVMEEDSSFESNLGLDVPTGSRTTFCWWAILLCWLNAGVDIDSFIADI